MMHAPLTDLPIAFGAVSVRAGGVDILRDITLSFSHGGPTVVMGPNGAGKSTLLRVAMGLTAPSHGTITWGGRAQSGVERRAFVFQRPVMMRRTAAQNIAFALTGLDGAAKRTRIDKALARTGLSALADRPARRLSGGEQQRLAIARALAREPEVLFLDEPTSNLDPAASKAIETIIRDATLSGIKIVMATHDLGQARRLASEIIFLVGGALAEHGPSETFFTHPTTQQAAAFLRGDIVE